MPALPAEGTRGPTRSPARDPPAAALQRGDRRRSAPRACRRDRLAAQTLRDPGARRLDRRDAALWCASKVEALREKGLDVVYIHRVDRTGYKAGALDERPEGRQGRARRDLRRRLPPAAGLPARGRPALHSGSEGRHGAGALGAPQPRALAPHADAGAHARRASPRREPRALGGRAGSSTSAAPAASGAKRRSRSAGGWQHDTLTEDLDSQLPRAARGLALRLPRERRHAGRAPRGHQRVPRAAVPLGQGHRADRAQADGAPDARRAHADAARRGVLPPDAALRLSAHGAAQRAAPAGARPHAGDEPEDHAHGRPAALHRRRRARSPAFYAMAEIGAGALGARRACADCRRSSRSAPGSRRT